MMLVKEQAEVRSVRLSSCLDRSMKGSHGHLHDPKGLSPVVLTTFQLGALHSPCH